MDKAPDEILDMLQVFLDSYGKDNEAALHAAYDIFAILGWI